MLNNLILSLFVPKGGFPKTVDHFSIEKVGRKFYVYAYTDKDSSARKKIGSYNSYETAKKAVDNILDLKLGDYGT